MVESVLSTMPLNASFHRLLNDNNHVLWKDLVGRIMHVRLNDRTMCSLGTYINTVTTRFTHSI
jgi:hypothetical protein